MSSIVIFFKKISDEIERYVISSPLKKLLRHLQKMLFIVVLTLFFTFPKETWAILFKISSQFNFFAPKFAFFWWVVYILLPYTKKLLQDPIEQISVEGIPIYELADHIILEKSFKRDDIESKFGLPRNRYQNLAKKLDEQCVFIRGENNERIIDKRLTRELIVQILKEMSSLPSPTQKNNLFIFLKKYIDFLHQYLTKPKEKPIGNPQETHFESRHI